MRKFIRIKALLLVGLLALATLMVLPSVAQIGNKTLPGWITERFDRTFKLGLDLQGGLHLEYSVAVDDALKNKVDRIGAELEAAFREKKNVKVSAKRVSLDELHLVFENPADVATATPDVMGIASGVLERQDSDQANIISMKMSELVMQEDRKAIVGQALETVRRRVDAMGIAEPNIYPKNRQIVIELPGLSDTGTELKAATDDAAAKLVGLLKESQLDASTIGVEGAPQAIELRIGASTDAEQSLRDAVGNAFIEDDEVRILDHPRVGVQFDVKPDPRGDVSKVVLELTQDAQDLVLAESSDFRRLLKVIERAAVLQMHLVDDETPFKGEDPYLAALFHAGFVTQGMGISVNKEGDYGRPEKGGITVKDPYAFFARDRETLERFFMQLPPEWRLPSSHRMGYGRVPVRTRRNADPEYLWRTYVLKARADITGDRIVNANVSFKADTGTPQVDVKFDRIGARAFDEMSGNNVGRKMAIIMDEGVVSDPIFNERISGGNVVITLGNAPGSSVRDQANDLAKVLKSGSLPARLQKEFEIRVGADLGKESVDRGFKAFVVGLGLVILFMGVYYRKAGRIAVFALVMNMILVLAAMSLFQATLTLPGIAGIVLTIGMAVDANVIIFERVREYVREGYTARAAIDAGYDRAFTTILDSQLTTAIAGLVLWQYGSGPIRGFAITLLIGIGTSIFTGVFATRVFFDWQANRRGFDKVSI